MVLPCSFIVGPRCLFSRAIKPKVFLFAVNADSGNPFSWTGKSPLVLMDALKARVIVLVSPLIADVLFDRSEPQVRNSVVPSVAVNVIDWPFWP